MNMEERRLQCLKMAFELGGNTDAVLSAAQRMLDFLNGTEFRPSAEAPSFAAAEAKAEAVAAALEQPSAETPVEQTLATTTPIVVEQAEETLIADPVSACGTALVMPEGGNLADAQPSPEVVADAAPAERDCATVEAPAQAEVTEVSAPVETTEAPAQAEATEAVTEVIEIVESAADEAVETPAQAEATEAVTEVVEIVESAADDAVEQAPAAEAIVPEAVTPVEGSEAAPPA